MTIRNLEHLLAPKSVALIGASGQDRQRRPDHGTKSPPRRLCRTGVARQSQAWRDRGPTLLSLRSPPCRPRRTWRSSSRRRHRPRPDRGAGQEGTRAAVVITAGVRDELRQADAGGRAAALLRIQGPNCVGLMVPRLGLNASFSASRRRSRRSRVPLAVGRPDHRHHRLGARAQHRLLARASRSATWPTSTSAICSTISPAMPRAAPSCSTWSRSPTRRSSCRRRGAAARAKPVIVVKAGRRRGGGQGRALPYRGAGRRRRWPTRRRSGAPACCACASSTSCSAPPRSWPGIRALTGDRLAILTNGGGAGVLAADRLGDLRRPLAALSDATLPRSMRVLPPTWSHGNPVDIIGDADPDRYTRALEAMLDDADVRCHPGDELPDGARLQHGGGRGGAGHGRKAQDGRQAAASRC